MSSIKIKKIGNESFIMIDGNKEISIDYKIANEKIKNEKGEVIKINEWIILPENSINRKAFRLDDFKTENEKEYFERKTPDKKSSVPKYDFEKYLTEEEKKILEDLKEKSRRRFEEEKEKFNNPKYKELQKNLKIIEESCKNLGLNPEDIEKYREAKKKIEDFKF